jgi:hypothetical protein
VRSSGGGSSQQSDPDILSCRFVRGRVPGGARVTPETARKGTVR